MLKTIIRTMLFVVFSLSAFQAAFAQPARVIKESELTTKIARAEEKLKTQKYRIRFVRDDDGEIRRGVYRTQIYEFVPPDRVRKVWTSVEDGGVKTMEEIFVGAKQFRKEHGEKWKDITNENYGVAGGGGGGGNADVSKTYRYLGKVTLNDQPADLYEEETIIEDAFQNRVFVRTETERYWFNAAGLFVKIASEYKSGASSQVRFTVSEYEYDPSIKIAAPRLARK